MGIQEAAEIYLVNLYEQAMLCDSCKTCYIDAKGYPTSIMHPWGNQPTFQKLRESDRCDDEFNSRIVCELVKNKNSCRINLASYPILS